MSRSKRGRSLRSSLTELPANFWVVIPDLKDLTDEERNVVDEGGSWPVRMVRHLPEHEALVDFLVERSLESWTRSRG